MEVKEINLSADILVSKLLQLSRTEMVCLLDSSGVNHLGSHLLIAGIKPLEVLELKHENPWETLKIFNKKVSQKNTACFFTISYDLGLKLENIRSRPKEFPSFSEPDIFLAVFDCLIIHDYNTGKTFLCGNKNKTDRIQKIISGSYAPEKSTNNINSAISSNFTKSEYLSTIKKIQEFIRRGDTYQTNLTQQFCAKLPEELPPQKIFRRLRKAHPAPFASFIKRKNDFVVSISPERFLKVTNQQNRTIIQTSPIKGTRPRGKTTEEDLLLRDELLKSEKDRAENTMIVDLLRNDLGRICQFGSVEVKKLCDLEKHPTLYHLVSTITGQLRNDVDFADIIKAVFPCGSITGAPKIRTMQIIDELERSRRGLSMGAIGYSMFEFESPLTDLKTKRQNDHPLSKVNILDLNVAIRTMVIRGHEAIFNVGGGIVIDSVPENEYEESLLKARALLKAIKADH